jgi:mono/diheme cytochrome c family protein
MACVPANADYLAMKGPELYQRFCSSCHGATGQGDGPVASNFKHEVPDLTSLARRHGGTFPRDQVERIIDGRYMLSAHGSRAMPVWGDGLSKSEIGNPDAERFTQTIIQRLTEHVQSLQKPPVPPAPRK